RRLRYIRYADDFLLGFAGPKKAAEAIRDRLSEFLRQNLKLELSMEKTLVTHAVTEKAKFLGYEITVTKANHLITENGKRGSNGRICLLMPHKVATKVQDQYSRGGKIRHRAELLADTDYTIILRYQSVLRGLYNYYCMATNVSGRMTRIKHILETSLTKTLAAKLRIPVEKVYEIYRAVNRVDNLLMLEVIVHRPDKDPLVATFGGFPFRRNPDGMAPDFQYEAAWFAPGSNRSEIIQRLLNDKCELCGAEGPAIRLSMHHIRHLKDLDKPGRRPKAEWQRIMSARKRKSLAVCHECHTSIHAGRYDGPSPVQFTGEPDAAKVAS